MKIKLVYVMTPRNKGIWNLLQQVQRIKSNIVNNNVIERKITGGRIRAITGDGNLSEAKKGERR